MEDKKLVKLIIAKTKIQAVYFNYGDDSTDITRILVEDHSPWEEVDVSELQDLEQFVHDFNCYSENHRDGFAFLIVKEEQISAQRAIEHIKKKREKHLKKQIEAERKRKELAEKQRQERRLKKLAKTKEQKLKLLAQLKEELGE
jgi:hypothetical protein